ncbi:MAG: glycosyltransferase family 2 protein [Solirubrobacteraceae bacterium]|nr:glycosyltransferase family 2 protein [Solirubrobacteraceae bacterium]
MPDLAPGVSVVIPARADEPFLAEAVDSALAQPETVQVVVGSFEPTGNTAQWCAAHPDGRVRWARSTQACAGANTDAALALTTASFVAFLDADDRWPAGRLAPALRALTGPPAAGLCLGWQQAMDEAGTLLPHTAPAPLMSAAVATRATVDLVGPFGNDLAAQMRWLVRARDLGVPTVRLEQVVMHRRAHGTNLTTVARPQVHQSYLQLARERAAAARARDANLDGQA